MKKLTYPTETKQVFDWLNLDGELSDFVCWYHEANNGSYHRWYPMHVNEKNNVGKFERFKNEEELRLGKLLNEWLVENGMVIDFNDEYFNVLIYVSW